MTIDFTKHVENFICEHCRSSIIGSGFTNHCPQCLWSKHVDITPGDRASHCNGMMEPILIEIQKGESVITHRCILCKYEKRNKTADNDSTDEIIRIMKLGNATDNFYRAQKIQANAKKR